MRKKKLVWTQHALCLFTFRLILCLITLHWCENVAVIFLEIIPQAYNDLRLLKLALLFNFLCFSLPLPPAVLRCSWLYTSVTMTSILLRSLLPRRHCAGMWWTCVRSRGRRTATCPRCGVDLVSGGASPPCVILNTHWGTWAFQSHDVLEYGYIPRDRSHCADTCLSSSF